MKLEKRDKKKNASATIAARVSSDLKSQLTDFCHQYRYTESEMIGKILEDWFANHNDVELIE